ncbi:MAG: hypothetical protein GC186_00115 [Rhodobacteraceae bacterium]|nr:hypothetical protein [Paracoccaceae bacterium]
MFDAAVYSKCRFADMIAMAEIIPKTYSMDEEKLMISSWPAYRFLSPMQKTRLFVAEYNNAYRDNARVNMDRNYAETANVIGKISFSKQSTQLTQAWNARRFADMAALPYDFFLRFSFEFYSRRKRKESPRPNQLCPKEGPMLAVWADILDAQWTIERKKLELSRMAPMAQYAVDYVTGLPAQTAFERELLEIGSDPSTRLSPFLANWVVAKAQLAPAACVGAFGEEIVTREVAFAEEDIASGKLTRHHHEAPHRLQRLQSCFGATGIDHDTSDVCASCPDIAKCRAFAAKSLDFVEQRTGSADPILERKRKLGRDRTAKSRANAKLAAASSTGIIPEE